MSAGLSIVWPALIAGLLITATHVPLGQQVLRRGIVFIDLAVAQIAGLGVVLADSMGFEPHGIGVQVAALAAATAGALLLNLTDRIWTEMQEAIIGVTFIVAANLAILLLASNPHGAENLKDLLVGQILWVSPSILPYVAAVYAAILALWFVYGARIGQVGFYLIFALAVTVSVQLVGLYLVFTTLIVPALATRHLQGHRLASAYVLSAIGYGVGLGVSLASDLPPGPLVVCCMTALGLVVLVLSSRRRIPT